MNLKACNPELQTSKASEVIYGFPKIKGTLLKGLYRGYIGIMEKKMDSTIQGLGFRYSGFPKIRGTFLGVPVIRTMVFGGLHGGPLFWETTI